MTALQVVRPSLAELAATANREHGLAVQSGVAMVEHAIKAGEALLEAHSACDRGEWVKWLEENFDGHQSMANGYMRCAHYQTEIRAVGLSTYNESRRFLRGLPGPPAAADRSYPSAVREQALAHLEAGKTTRETATLMGVSRAAIRAWADPEYAEQHRQRARDRRSEAPPRPRREPTRPPSFGRSTLAALVRNVIAADAAQDREALIAILRDGSDQLAAWADHLEEAA